MRFIFVAKSANSMRTASVSTPTHRSGDLIASLHLAVVTFHHEFSGDRMGWLSLVELIRRVMILLLNCVSCRSEKRISTDSLRSTVYDYGIPPALLSHFRHPDEDDESRQHISMYSNS